MIMNENYKNLKRFTQIKIQALINHFYKKEWQGLNKFIKVALNENANCPGIVAVGMEPSRYKSRDGSLDRMCYQIN